MRGKTMVAKVAKQEIALNLPRRPTTVERYLKIVKFALGRDRDVEAVAKHFGCSPATVLNAIRAFGVTYDQVRRRRTLPQLKVAEEYIKLERRLSERDQKIIEMYNSPEAPTLEQIGRAFGLTRQRVHQILKKAKALGVKLVERKTPPEGHWIERCQLCKRLLQLQEEEPLLTRRQIAARLDIPIWVVHWHLNRLKARGLVKRHFGYFRSSLASTPRSSLIAGSFARIFALTPPIAAPCGERGCSPKMRRRGSSRDWNVFSNARNEIPAIWSVPLRRMSMGSSKRAWPS